jgi:hypothetical protein
LDEKVSSELITFIDLSQQCESFCTREASVWGIKTWKLVFNFRPREDASKTEGISKILARAIENLL